MIYWILNKLFLLQTLIQVELSFVNNLNVIITMIIFIFRRINFLPCIWLLLPSQYNVPVLELDWFNIVIFNQLSHFKFIYFIETFHVDQKWVHHLFVILFHHFHYFVLCFISQSNTNQVCRCNQMVMLQFRVFNNRHVGKGI